MIPYLEDKLKMFDEVDAFRERHQAAIAAIPELLNSFMDFHSRILIIKDKNETTQNAKSGKLEAKLDAKGILVTSIVPAVRSLHSYARKNKLNDIIAITKGVTRASLLKLNKIEFDTKIDSFYKLLDANRAKLSGFNVDSAKVDTIKTNIDAYNAAEKDHHASGEQKSAAHMSLDEAFDTADDILKEDIDGMMEHFIDSNIDMYNEYQSARVIKNISGSKTAPAAEAPAAEQPKTV